jgi:hypothetical protein
MMFLPGAGLFRAKPAFTISVCVKTLQIPAYRQA